jgi:hypothetical protein
MADLESIQQKIIAFRNERDWAQLHEPENLAEALSSETGCCLETSVGILLSIPVTTPYLIPRIYKYKYRSYL